MTSADHLWAKDDTDGRYFALASSDGQVLVFDACEDGYAGTIKGLRAKRSKTPASGSSASISINHGQKAKPTSIAIRSGVRRPDGPTAQSSVAGISEVYVAIGFSNGIVVVADIHSSDQIVHVVEMHPSSAVTGITFNQSALKLYTCGSDMRVAVIDIHPGRPIAMRTLSYIPSKSVPTALSISPCETMIAVGAGLILLISLVHGVVIRKFVGHASPVLQMSFLPDSGWLLSAAQNDRYICQWCCVDTLDVANGLSIVPHANEQKGDESNENLQASKKRLKTDTIIDESEVNQQVNLWTEQKPVPATKVFLSESRISGIFLNHWLNGSAFTFGVVDIHGNIQLWKKQKIPTAVTGAERPVLPTERIRSADFGDVIGCASFRTENELLTVSGFAFSPSFLVVDLNRDLVSQFAASGQRNTGTGDVDSSLPPGSRNTVSDRKTKSILRQEATVPLVDGAAVPINVTQAAGLSTYVIAMETASNKLHVRDEEDILEDEPTLGEKLSKLGVVSANQGPDTVPESDEKQGGLKVSAESVTRLIQQALATQDDKLLEQGLQAVRSKQAIRHTVESMETSSVILLLEALVRRFQSRSSRAPTLILWLNIIIHAHTAIIISSPNAHRHLSILSQALGQRVRTFDEFRSLQGRLEAMQHMSIAENVSKSASSVNMYEPLVTFDEAGFAEPPDQRFDMDTHIHGNDSKEDTLARMKGFVVHEEEDEALEDMDE